MKYIQSLSQFISESKSGITKLYLLTFEEAKKKTVRLHNPKQFVREWLKDESLPKGLNDGFHLIQTKYIEYFAYYSNGKPVGLIVYYPKENEIGITVVSDKYQRRGIANLLYSKIEDMYGYVESSGTMSPDVIWIRWKKSVQYAINHNLYDDAIINGEITEEKRDKIIEYLKRGY